MFKFSPKQLEVIKYISKGLTPREIAKELFICVKTVQFHIQEIYDEIESFGYKRTMHQVAILYISNPDLFETRKRERNQLATKKTIAMNMLRQRIHYKSVAERLKIPISSCGTYKNLIHKKQFYTLPYLYKL